jgi:hypothetical protein
VTFRGGKERARIDWGNKPVRLFREQPGTQFKTAHLPDGRELMDSGLNDLAEFLTGLTLEDVLPLQSVQMPSDDKLLKAVYHAFDGVKVSVSAWKQGDQHYARILPVLEQAEAEAYIQADQAKAKAEYEEKRKSDDKAAAPLSVSDPAKDREQRLAQLATEVGDISQRVEGWVYVLPSHKYAHLNQSMEDLLKPLESTKSESSKTEAKTPEGKKPIGKKH